MAEPQRQPTPALNPQQAARKAEADAQAARHRAAQQSLQAAQLKAPATPPDAAPPALPGSTAQPWHVRAEAYLDGKGWERCGTNGRGQTLWTDPLCNARVGEHTVHVRDLPSSDATVGPLVVNQLKVPPVRWDTATEEAYTIQLARDRAAAKAAGSAAGAPQTPAGAAV